MKPNVVETGDSRYLAALADEAWFAYISSGGQSERLAHRLTAWRVPFSILERP